ncbi:toprim domain-containing protein [Tenacibaculum dicentrarchi]|nr:toprim domain-containing protein [Tenacibaculum dicentrarchi]MCD8421080.1 toprim domain-containing protein [Tenacibaculum dicentrarchi]
MNIFDEIKQKIDLLNHLGTLNFSVSRKSTKKHIVLENETTGEKLLVFDKDSKGNSYGYWIYKNLLIDNDKGDILTFIRNRINGMVIVDYSKEATAEAIKVLKPFLNEPPTVNIKMEKSVKKQKLKKELSSSNYTTKPIENFNFLYQRGIHTSTIEHKDFKNKIFNAFYFDKNNHLRINTAFSKSIDWNTEPVGYEIRNHKIRKVENDSEIKQVYIPFKSVAFDDAALFMSNISKPKEKITHLFFAESAIDILSYHELLRANKKGYDFSENNHLFISFGGNIYDQKLSNLKKSLGLLNIDSSKTKFICITDNDEKGYYYDLTLTVLLINQYKSPIKLSIKDTVYYQLEFETSSIDISKFNTSIKEYNKQIEKEILPEQAINLQEKFIVFNNNTIEDNQMPKGELLLPIEENSIENSIKLLAELFDAPNFYIPHKPSEKGIDWNDQLLIKKKIKTPALILKERACIKKIQKEITECKSVKVRMSEKKQGIKPRI